MPDASRFPLIPWPRRVEPGDGELRLERGSGVAWSDPALRPVASLLMEHTDGLLGEAATTSAAVRLDLGGAGGREAYVLEVTSSRARITSPSARGAIHGAQTLRQLMRHMGGGVRIPAVRIEDSPRFGWRGLHLDVSRHFFPIPFIKRYLDLMSLYKLNTFHWHLTDDQGWRLEIASHLRLTAVGSRRRETIVGRARRGAETYDGTPHGGFYTQAQAREVVAYARDRGIDVLPEIEMPGHSMAALAAYPELACRPGPFEVATKWGVYEDICCPKESTFALLEDVLREVLAIFPNDYVHIGGDEVPKTRWKECAVAQDVMRREGLADEAALQSWFIQRIERFLNANGRRLVGWDEILEGGLAPDATVMSWRGIAGGVAAAKAGHDVVMTPQEDLYFDHYQGDPATEPLAHGGHTTLDDVYAYDPVPPELSSDEASHVLGTQGCVWTEHMATPDQVEYMLFPRALALAEIAWSERHARDPRSFRARAEAALPLLDRLGVRYRREPSGSGALR